MPAREAVGREGACAVRRSRRGRKRCHRPSLSRRSGRRRWRSRKGGRRRRAAPLAERRPPAHQARHCPAQRRHAYRRPTSRLISASLDPARPGGERAPVECCGRSQAGDLLDRVLLQRARLCVESDLPRQSLGRRWRNRRPPPVDPPAQVKPTARRGPRAVCGVRPSLARRFPPASVGYSLSLDA